MAESGITSDPITEGLKLEETIISPSDDTTRSFSLEAWQSSIPTLEFAATDSSPLRFDLGLPEFNSDNRDAKPDRTKWLNFGALSYHENREANYNETNYGFGFEQDLSANKGFSFGYYKNSNYDNSAYALYHWTPLQKGPLKFGLIGGAVTGYSLPVTPMILPMLKLEGSKVGANFFCLPPIGDVSAVCAAQLKVKIK